MKHLSTIIKASLMLGFAACQSFSAVNADGILTDAKLCDVFHILRTESDQSIPANNRIQGLDAYCQENLFKSAAYFDQLNTQGIAADFPTTAVAESILGWIESEPLHDVFPDVSAETTVTLACLTGLVKPTIDLRIDAITRATQDLESQGKLVGRIYVSIPVGMKPEMMDYMDEKLSTLQSGYSIEKVMCTDPKDNTQSFFMQLADKVTDIDRVVVLTDKTFSDKIPGIANQFIPAQFLGAAYYDLPERQKSLFYGYDLSANHALINWIGNYLNFSVARVVHSHFQVWQKDS